MQEVRDFVVVGDSARRRASERVRAALAAWCVAWRVPLEIFELEAKPFDPDPAEGAGRWFASARGALAAFPPAFENGVREAVLPGAAVDSMGAHAGGQAWNAFRRDVLSVGEGDRVEVPWALIAPGAGSIVVRIALGVAAAEVVVPHERSAEIAGVERAPDGKGAAIDALPLKLRAELSTLEISVEALRQLREGDVVELMTPLSSPADIVGPDGERLFHGYLCKREGRRALDVVALAQGERM